MDHSNSHGKFPHVVIDKENNFTSIKLKEGIETLSYIRDGVLFSEDSDGNIIEIQILSIEGLMEPVSDSASG